MDLPPTPVPFDVLEMKKQPTGTSQIQSTAYIVDGLFSKRTEVVKIKEGDGYIPQIENAHIR